MLRFSPVLMPVTVCCPFILFVFVYGRMNVRYGMYESDGVHDPSPTVERLNPVSLSINQQSYCVALTLLWLNPKKPSYQGCSNVNMFGESDSHNKCTNTKL